MEPFDYAYMCRHLAKSTSSTVRVYDKNEQISFYSVWDLSPDPITPYIGEILQTGTPCGTYTTPLFQLYSFFTVLGRYKFVIGPSGLASKDVRGLAELYLELGVPKEKQEDYTRILRCAPMLTLEKNISLLKLLVYASNRDKPESDEMFCNKKATEQYASVANTNSENAVKLSYEDKQGDEVERAYQLELMLWGLIRAGQDEKLREIFSGMPNVHAGEMAHDAMRQAKTEAVCGATMASRAAIEGGLDCATAFAISDLFIQKAELTHDNHSLQRLLWDLFLDYAARVRTAHYGLSNNSPLFIKCAKYVSRNLAQHITVDEMAQKLNISRAYLCTRFKKESGISLTQYILQEKVFEAQRLIQNTSHSLLEISDYLAFSSQSHFQAVFKKVTGQTPAQFRKR